VNAGISEFELRRMQSGQPGVPSPEFEEDRACDQCGYNLRGLRMDQACPECGHVRPRRTKRAVSEDDSMLVLPIRVLDRIAAGTLLCLVWVVLAIASLVLGGLREALAWPMLALLAVSAVLGSWLATPPLDQPIARRYWLGRGSPLRWIVRGASLVWAANAIVRAILVLGPGGATGLEDLLPLIHLASIVAILAPLVFFEQIAAWVRDDDARGIVTIAIVGSLFLVLATAAAAVPGGSIAIVLVLVLILFGLARSVLNLGVTMVNLPFHARERAARDARRRVRMLGELEGTSADGGR